MVEVLIVSCVLWAAIYIVIFPAMSGSAGPAISSALLISSVVMLVLLMRFLLMYCLKVLVPGHASASCISLASLAPLISFLVQKDLLCATVDKKLRCVLLIGWEIFNLVESM